MPMRRSVIIACWWILFGVHGAHAADIKQSDVYRRIKKKIDSLLYRKGFHWDDINTAYAELDLI